MSSIHSTITSTQLSGRAALILICLIFLPLIAVHFAHQKDYTALQNTPICLHLTTLKPIAASAC